MEEQTKSSLEGNAEEITSDYANNVYFVASVWDLKILFGELGSSNREVDWHTSITLPWAQAKIMAYYLQVNIALHESNNGPIKIPTSMIPPAPPPIAEADKDNPSVKALTEYIENQRKLFLESLK